MKKTLKFCRVCCLVLLILVLVTAVIYAVAVAIAGGPIELKIQYFERTFGEISDYPEEYKYIYEAAAGNALYSNTIVDAKLIEDDGVNCIFEVTKIYYAENTSYNRYGEKQNHRFTELVEGHRITSPISNEHRELPFWIEILPGNKYVNKYWTRHNLLTELKIGNTYTVFIDKDPYYGDTKGEHKGKLVFIIDAKFPRGNIQGDYDATYIDPVYINIGYYAAYIRSNNLHKIKNYTGLR